jgi:hypothetical protein
MLRILNFLHKIKKISPINLLKIIQIKRAIKVISTYFIQKMMHNILKANQN